MRVRAHIVVVAGMAGDRPEMVEEHERAHRLADCRWQETPHHEAAAKVFEMRFEHVLDGHVCLLFAGA